MSSRATMAHISSLVRAKRREGGIGLRHAAEQSGISASTLSRLERGAATALPDAETLSKLSTWLQVPIGVLIEEMQPIAPEARPELSTPEVVEVHLRADKTLSPETAEALSKMFSLLYKQFARMENHADSDAKIGESRHVERSFY